MAEEDDDCYYTLPPSLTCSPLPKPTSSGCHGGDQVMELLWQNGQVVMQGKRSHRKKSDDDDHHHSVDSIPSVVAGGSPPLHLNHDDPLLHPQQHNDIANNNLFIQEDEMATWLLSNFYSDLLLPSSSTSPTATAPAPSAIASHHACPTPAAPLPRRFESFGHFSRLNRPIAIEATVVDSSDTPMVARVSDNTAGCDVARVSAESISAGVRDAATCDLTVTSSSGASSESTEPIPPVKTHKAAPHLPSPRKTTADEPEERKRTARDGGGRLDNGEDGEKLVLGSSSTKRSRAAEVHNLSERRRRDRINEKMRALQELIPHCHKADKASMLDEAIEYLKSLQMQVQMMSMGCGMMPMMHPYLGVRQYLPPMDMGMGIGIGLEMRTNRPIMQFPRLFPCSNLPTGGAGPPTCPRFRFPAFQIPPHIPSPNPWRVPLSNQPGSASSSVPAQNQPRIPGFVDPYQQFLGLQHLHSNTCSGGMATTSKAGENSQKASPD